MTASQWQYFSMEELQCKCGCGRADMDDNFMKMIVAIRKMAAFPFYVSSGYRCPQHNQAVSKTRSLNGPHTFGMAIDLKLWGSKADRVIELSYTQPITGRGYRQKGNHKNRFIHLDCLPNSIVHPRPWVWSY